LNDSSDHELEDIMRTDLEDLAQEFASWRERRPSRRTKTPDELRTKAINLIGPYKISHVAKRLSLAVSDLRRWQKQMPAPTVAPRFVELPGSDQLPTAKSQPSTLRIDRPDGISLSIEGCSESALFNLIHQFVKGDVQ
jgi:hypothetical protein